MILVIGGVAANSVYGIVRTSLLSVELGHANLLAGVARAAVWMFGIVLAV